jgi:hypothetical protein
MQKELLINLVETAINKKTSNLDERVFSIEGFSGKKFKYFLNNLLCEANGLSYLEIGVWKGSTTIAGLYNNTEKLKYYLIDNFSEFGGPKHEFENNFKTFLNKESNIIDKDCFKIDTKKYGIKNIDIYFYDGPHEEQQHYDALSYYYSSMNTNFIYIVDDWNWEKVKLGTYRAIHDLKLKTNKLIEYHTSFQDSETWWNGCSIFVFEK